MNANFGGVGFASTSADIYFDPALKLEKVEMSLNTTVAKYIRTFELFKKSTRIDLTQGYQEGRWSGLLDGTAASATRSGLSDSFVRIAMNVYGAPPLKGKAFGAYRGGQNVETIVGLGLAVRLPTGDYHEEKLINLGQNRFAFRPQIGVIHKRGKWSYEATGEVSIYTDNSEFYNGNTLEQAPLYFVHGHVMYTFRPGMWLGVSGGFDYGGNSKVNGVDKDNRGQNVGWAFNFACPITRKMGAKVTYVGSRTKENVGFDSQTLAAGLAFMW